MKHGVVVASPRAGITRDKYSANKSSHHPPPSPPSLAVTLLSLCYLQNVARGWSVRGCRQFLTSRAVYRRWPPTSMPGGRVAAAGGTFDVFDARFISCHARARAREFALSLSLSPSFFFHVFPFLRLFYATARFFSPFLVDAGLLGNYQSGSSDRKYPAHPSPFATCVRGVPAATPPLISASLPLSCVPGYPPPPPSPYVH